MFDEAEKIEEELSAESKRPVLDAIEARILGCLMEKEKTTPAYYPMTRNSLTAACNQKSSREPVMELSEREVESGLERLRLKHLASLVSMAGSHVPRYQHMMERLMGSGEAGQSVISVLLLRGPQTVGQLRQRTERQYHFPDMAEVVDTLNALAHDYDEPLVTMLPREAGRKDHRYMHLLCGDVVVEELPSDPKPPAPSPDAIQTLQQELTELREELRQLQSAFYEFRGKFE